MALMDPDLYIRAGNYYTGLLEQGVARAAAIEHTRQRFGLNDEQLRHVVAHNFILAINDEGVSDEEADGQLSDLLLTYAEAREALVAGFHLPDNGEIPYYGD